MAEINLQLPTIIYDCPHCNIDHPAVMQLVFNLSPTANSRPGFSFPAIFLTQGSRDGKVRRPKRRT